MPGSYTVDIQVGPVETDDHAAFEHIVENALYVHLSLDALTFSPLSLGFRLFQFSDSPAQLCQFIHRLSLCFQNSKGFFRTLPKPVCFKSTQPIEISINNKTTFYHTHPAAPSYHAGLLWCKFDDLFPFLDLKFHAK